MQNIATKNTTNFLQQDPGGRKKLQELWRVGQESNLISAAFTAPRASHYTTDPNALRASRGPFQALPLSSQGLEVSVKTGTGARQSAPQLLLHPAPWPELLLAQKLSGAMCSDRYLAELLRPLLLTALA